MEVFLKILIYFRYIFFLIYLLIWCVINGLFGLKMVKLILFLLLFKKLEVFVVFISVEINILFLFI